MKEKLYTVEVIDALNTADECPCCYLERKIEQDTISFVLGASYMESDIREETDRMGFCRHHMKMMYDYGNSLGNAWILKTRLEYVRRQFHDQAVRAGEAKEAKGSGGRISKILGGSRTGGSLWPGRRRGPARSVPSGTADGQLSQLSDSSCYVCERFEEAYGRILKTFLHLMRTEPEFLDRLKASKGFCLPHFADIMAAYTEQASEKERRTVVPALYQMMEENLERIQKDIDWFIDKFDHRNRDADWRDSKDAVPRTMQKLAGAYPADPVFRQK